jgi:hypothetical protein
MLTSSAGRPMNIKTALCREFEKDLDSRLLKESEQIEKFFNEFDKKENYIKAEYIIFTPASELFTKEGAISSRSVDTDAHKVMRDVIYQHIGIDDKVERETCFYTQISTSGNWDYHITLILRKISDLYV